jgi:hypothetical protein
MLSLRLRAERQPFVRGRESGRKSEEPGPVPRDAGRHGRRPVLCRCALPPYCPRRTPPIAVAAAPPRYVLRRNAAHVTAHGGHPKWNGSDAEFF